MKRKWQVKIDSHLSLNAITVYQIITNLSRATSFNKHNVNLFFTNLKTIYRRLRMEPSDIWNGGDRNYYYSTPNRVVACGMKQLGKITSAERRTLVTIAISAIGNMVPSFFIFPRVKDHFVQRGLLEFEDDANSSSWMKEEHFIKYCKHFVRNIRPSKDVRPSKERSFSFI